MQSSVCRGDVWFRLFRKKSRNKVEEKSKKCRWKVEKSGKSRAIVFFNFFSAFFRLLSWKRHLLLNFPVEIRVDFLLDPWTFGWTFGWSFGLLIGPLDFWFDLLTFWRLFFNYWLDLGINFCLFWRLSKRVCLTCYFFHKVSQLINQSIN